VHLELDRIADLQQLLLVVQAGDAKLELGQD
jgi:hypothetical protein